MWSLLKKQIVLQDAGALTNYIVLHIAFLFGNMSCPIYKTISFTWCCRWDWVIMIERISDMVVIFNPQLRQGT